MEKKALLNIERNVLYVAAAVISSIMLCYYGVNLVLDMKPLGFFVMIPASVLAFQTLWYLLTPFGTVFHDKFEIRQSWFHQKERYFNDLDKLSEKNGRLFITYTDGEVEKISLFGIRPSQRQALKDSFSQQIAAHATTRLV